jgi:hypothetical protein
MLHFFGTGYHLSENSYTTYEMSNREIAKWGEYYYRLLREQVIKEHN